MRYIRFEDMEVWEMSRVLVREIYIHTQKGTVAKDFGFIDQIRRAGISVMNNIAEGFERKSNKEFIYFLYIAKSSCAEVRSMLYIASDIGYIDKAKIGELFEQTETISKSLSGFIKYLSNNTKQPPGKNNPKSPNPLP